MKKFYSLVLLCFVLILFVQKGLGQKKWTGAATDGLWTTASNWNPIGTPGNTDDVILDNTNASGSYTVTLNGSTVQTVRSLQIGYSGNTNTITLIVNSSTANVLTVSGGGSTAVNITDGGVLNNQSTSATRGIKLNSTTDVFKMSGNGTYIHSTTTSGSGIPQVTSGTTSSNYNFASTSNFINRSGTGGANGSFSSLPTYGNYIYDIAAANNANVSLTIVGNLSVLQGTLGVSSTTSATFSVAGNVNISSGATFRGSAGVGTATINIVGDVSGQGTFQGSISAGTITNITVGGSVTSLIDLNSQSTSLTFSGGTPIVSFSPSNPSTPFVRNITISNNKTVILGTSIGVTSPYTFMVELGATLVSGANIISGGGNFTLSAGATLKIGDPGGIRSGSSAIGNIQVTGTRTFDVAANYAYNGTSAQVTGSGLTGANNLTITNSAGVTVSNAVSVTNSVSFGNINNATLVSNGNLILKSTSTATARIADITNNNSNTGNSITGTVTVERYVPATGRKYRMLAPQTTGAQTIRQAWQENGAAVNNLGTWITSNVPSAVSNGFDDVSQSPSILVWDSTTSSTNSWYDRLVDNTNVKQLSSEPGYLLFIRGDRTATPANSTNNVTTLKSTGSLRVGPQTTTVVGTAAGAERYTLVGNPYASPIDFEQVYTNTLTTNIKSQFWIWDARRSGLGGYTLIRRTGVNSYEAVPSPFGGANDSTTSTLQHIQSGQAFFVEPLTTSGGQVYIEENDKSAITYNSIFKTRGSTIPTFKINLSQQNGDVVELTDGVMAAYSSDYTAGIDANDVSKLNNFGENISLKRGAKNLTFESRPIISSQDTLFLNITSTAQRDYQLAFKAENFSSSNVSAFLEDRFLKTKVPVSLSEVTTINFSVTSDPASADVNRFDVVFAANSTLPVNFTTIKAFRKGQDIQVEWNVATENNIDHYVVEKSVNARQFTNAASINPIVNNNGSATYNWTDVGATSNDNYYRIKAISNTGSVMLSSIVKVNSLKTKGGIVVYPNPVFNKNLSLQFSNQPAGKYNIQLINNNGQQVFNKSIEHQEGSSTQTLQLGNNVTKGVYELKISNGGNTITQKIICN